MSLTLLQGEVVKINSNAKMKEMNETKLLMIQRTHKGQGSKQIKEGKTEAMVWGVRESLSNL